MIGETGGSGADSEESVGSDRIVRALAEGGCVRVVHVSAADVVAKAAAVHHLSPVVVPLCAECVVAAALMASWIDGEERVTLQVQASKPAFSFIADVRADGGIRCRLSPNHLQWRGTFDGMMLAIKTNVDRDVYRGATEIKNGNVADALRQHLGSSEQVSVRLHIDPARATGLLLERLPEDPTRPSLDEETFAARYQDATDPPSDLRVLAHRPLVWSCGCSMDKVEVTLKGLGAVALAEMIADGQPVEVTCHFCCEVRTVSVERLRELASA